MPKIRVEIEVPEKQCATCDWLDRDHHSATFKRTLATSSKGERHD